MSQSCEWRSLVERPIQAEVYDLWRQVKRIIAADLGTRGTPRPSPTALIEAVSLTIIQEYESRIPPHYWDDVIEGHAHCWFPLDGGTEYTIADTGTTLTVCHSYANLERHHLTPRSLSSGDGPLAWLCAPHHRQVSDGIDNKDWRWLRLQLGYDTEER